MNTKNKFVLHGAATALALGLAAGTYAQNTEDRGRTTDPTLGGTVTTDRSTDLNREAHLSSDRIGTSTEYAETAVTKANKASDLIGMNVYNPQDERLGEIKDLVVDLSSGKVSYAVLSVGGFLGIGDKYIAVPPNAFTVAANQDQLVLNADKAKIESAPGFAKSSWPNLNSKSWETDSAYWLPEGTARGTAGAIRSGTGTAEGNWVPVPSTSDRGTAPSGTTDTDQFRSDTTDRLDADRSSSETFRGRITMINPENRTMTVQGDAGTREFKLDEKATITMKDSRNPSLTDLKVGFPVEVGYHKEGENHIAHSVNRTDAPEVR